MKKLFTFLMAWLMLAGIAHAQSTPFVVGYCDGQVSTIATQDFSVSGKMWISAAVFIPAGQAQALAGNRIETIRAGVANRTNVDSVRVWIRTSLDGENLVSGLKTGTDIVKGWNEFTLDTPYEIPEGTEGFYMGYSFHQKAKAYALSILTDPQPNGLFVQVGSEEWADHSGMGILCIEGDVYGDYLPQYDLQLESIATGKYYSLRSGELEVTANLRNNAMATINNYKAVCQFEGYEGTIVADINKPIAYRERKQVKFVIRPEMITSVPDGPVKLSVTIQDLDGNEDVNMDNNTAETSVLVIDNVFVRNVLVEEFTTEKCPNCPRVANWLHSSMDKPEFANVILWEHHSGYYTDVYTTSFDQSYMWFYNAGGSTYAPALMFDRFPQPAEQNTTPVTLPGSQTALENLIRARMDEPALVDVKIKAGYQEDGKLKVIVTGERTQTDVPGSRITVSLVEDNIVSNNQSGASGAFTHHNVGRAINATWGEAIEWNDNTFRYEYVFDVNSAWNKDNLAIIALVSDYKSGDPTACEVANTNLLKAADFGDISEEPAKTYIIGSLPAFGEWNPEAPVEMTEDEENAGVYTIKATVDGEAWFVFTEGTGSWDAINAKRYGPTDGDQEIAIGEDITTQFSANTSAAYKMTGNGGEYTITFNKTALTFRVDGEVVPEPDYLLHYGAEGAEWQDATFVPGEGENEGKLVAADVEFAQGTEFKVNHGEEWYGGVTAEGETAYLLHYGWCENIPLDLTGSNFRINEAGTYTFVLTIGEESKTLTVLGFTAPAVPGDSNGDGKVDIADVNSVINQMLGKEAMIPACDMNGDGKIDIADVNAVINKMLGK